MFDTIAAEKDVDGFSAESVGLLVQNRPKLVACTPTGVIELLEREGIPIAGRHAVVIGRSDIVGKPMAMLLLHRDATVTIAHSRTPDLAGAAAARISSWPRWGKAGLVIEAISSSRGRRDRRGDESRDRSRRSRRACIPPGHRRLELFKSKGAMLVGDVHPDVAEVAGALTPVPGGVGPLTITMLMNNTLRAARSRVEGPPSHPATQSPSYPATQHPFIDPTDLRIGVLIRPVSSDHVIRTLNLLRDRKLSIQPLPGLGFGEGIALNDSSNLRGWITRGDDHHVEVMVPAGFVEERDVGDRKAVAGGVERREPVVDRSPDRRVDDGFQIPPRGGIFEDESGHSPPVQAARSIEDAHTEAIDDRSQSRGARRYRLTREHIGIDCRDAGLLELLQHVALAGCDSACQGDAVYLMHAGRAITAGTTSQSRSPPPVAHPPPR